jgi:hypothetical protein
MSDLIIEQELLSTLEQLTTSSANVLANKRKRRRAALLAELRVAACSLQAKRVAKRLRIIWKDSEGSRAQSLSAMGVGSTTTDPIDLYYSKLSESREFHKRLNESNGGNSTVAGVDGSFVSEDTLATELGNKGERGIDLRPAWMTASSVLPTVIPQQQQQQQQQKRLEVNRDAMLAASRDLSAFGDDEIFGAYVDLSGSGHFEAFCNLPGVKEARFSAAGGKNFLTDSTSSSTTSQPHSHSKPSMVANLDYPGFLRHLSNLHSNSFLPLQPTRSSRQYKRHIYSLVQYLFSFFQRTHPLIDAVALFNEWLAEFEADWNSKKVQSSWEVNISVLSKEHESKSLNSSSVLTRADLEKFNSENDLLIALGAEGCKEQLRLRGLKQGGSPIERASRLFSVRTIEGIDPSNFPSKLRAPASTAITILRDVSKVADQNIYKEKETTAVIDEVTSQTVSSLIPISSVERVDVSEMAALRLSVLSNESYISSAWLEYCLARLCAVLFDVIRESVRRAERRLTKTLEEIHAERLTERHAEEEDEEEDFHVGNTSLDSRSLKTKPVFANRSLNVEDEDEDEDEGRVFNPMNIPLGADGKPIPYWLFKMNGLNVSFSCEICGGASYRGNREFDRHFQEIKHALGMKALGIPNTKAFHGVITIKDAQLLFEKIKKRGDNNSGVGKGLIGSKKDDVEEFQDSSGNVVDKKTYADLARCGLL